MENQQNMSSHEVLNEKPVNNFHKNIINNLKKKNNIFTFLIGVFMFAHIIPFRTEVKIMKEMTDAPAFMYIIIIFYIFYVLFGLIPIYFAVSGIGLPKSKLFPFIPFILYFTASILIFIVITDMTPTEAFKNSFAAQSPLFISLLLMVISFGDKVLDDASNITKMFISAFLVSFIYDQFLATIKEIIYYSTANTGTDLALYEIIVFFIFIAGFGYTVYKYIPSANGRKILQSNNKYIIYLPVLSILLIILIKSLLFDSINVDQDKFFVIGAYVILSTIIMTGTEILKESDSYISRAVFKINFFLFTSHLRILNKYKNYQKEIDKDKYSTNKPTIEFVFALFRNMIFIYIWILCFACIALLTISPTTFSVWEYSKLLPIFNPDLTRLFVMKDVIILGSNKFYLEFLSYFVIFFFHLPILSIVITFVYEFVEILFRKYYTTVYFETKSVKE